MEEGSQAGFEGACDPGLDILDDDLDEVLNALSDVDDDLDDLKGKLLSFDYMPTQFHPTDTQRCRRSRDCMLSDCLWEVVPSNS